MQMWPSTLVPLTWSGSQYESSCLGAASVLCGVSAGAEAGVLVGVAGLGGMLLQSESM